MKNKILTHLDITSNKMCWFDIVKHHIPDINDEEIENIFNWCYNLASSKSGTCNPKNSLILNCFQYDYLDLYFESLTIKI